MEVDKNTVQTEDNEGDADNGADRGGAEVQRGCRRHEHRARPGPQTRREAIAAAEDDQRQRWRDRQRRSRANRRHGDVAGAGRQQGADDRNIRWGFQRNRSSVWRRAHRISTSLARLLDRILDPDFRAEVLEKVFANRTIRQLLPQHYPAPEQARAQRQILENIRGDLVAMKIPHSSGMLARKRAILEAVVSQLDSDISKFHTSILGTRKANLVAAMERLRSTATGSSSRFAVPSRKRREGGISDEVKTLVVHWWTAETRVSRGCRDVRRKRLCQNSYERHVAHLLMETQVFSLSKPSIAFLNFIV